MASYLLNPVARGGKPPMGLFAAENYADVESFFNPLPGYCPTPLRNLPALAKEIGVGEILVKDESSRFGLPAFKILGVLYAIDRLHRSGLIKKNSVVACATDGNHGRALAYAARRYGLDAKVFIHSGAALARVQAIATEGAEVIVVDGNYDDSVREAAHAADARGWLLFSDTSWPGNEIVPTYIMAGYTILMTEAVRQWNRIPDVVFVQAGVGGLACSIVSWLAHMYGASRPLTVCCEPDNAACVLEALRAGQPTELRGSLETVMAGLSCGTISFLAWPTLRQGLDACLTVSDHASLEGVRRLSFPQSDDPAIVAGESGACGVAALWSMFRCDKLEPFRRSLRIDERSRILLINTEGPTDPHSYHLATGLPIESNQRL